jgi:Amt family ammonium transporter
MESLMKFPTSLTAAAKSALLGTATLGILGTAAAFAQEAAAPAAEAAAATPVIDKGDVAWMMTSSLLVLFMLIPGLALFYGGLVRAKNMLSVLMQCTVIGAVVMIVWVVWGYSVAFGGGTSPFWGGFGKLFLAGVTGDSTAATFTDGVVLPEYIFIVFQMTFAAITPALIVGAFAERIKFSAVILFVVLWVTFVYFPVAHMVWDASGYIFGLGAIDFAGGTVVHINAGVAGLVCALVLGKRVGLGKDLMAPHNLTFVLTGTGLLLFGWYGFNAGSSLESNGLTALVILNTTIAAGAAALAWIAGEWMFRGHPSLLGGASGMVAGLVAITPACGWVGPGGAIIIGFAAGFICLWAVVFLKNRFGYDDALDVFGVHGIGGIIGAILTGIFVNPALGGMGVVDYLAADNSVGALPYDFGTQMYAQVVAVIIAVVWTTIVSYVALMICKATVGLRVKEQEEREGLDLADHGERAYN